LEFWNADHHIYINDRHRDAHFHRVAEDILEALPAGRPRVLDYGCGLAVYAQRVAARCAKLYLYDEARDMHETLARRYAEAPEIVVVAPGQLSLLDAGILDMIVVNSVIQYLAQEDLERLLALWRRLLNPGGALILADVVPPEADVAADVMALLRYARDEGFLGAALLGLVRLLASDYVQARRMHGFTHYRESEMLALLEKAGYRGERRGHNFGINPRRMTFVARPWV
jgi:SAM-dependent methyltransferase